MRNRPEPGVPEELEPGIRRILAPNPSAMTHWGTNTYLVGDTTLAIIDPGPDSPAHLDAVLAATGTTRVSHILVTHAHRDHSGLALDLCRLTGAPVLGFGPPEAGRSARMAALAADGGIGGGEGVDSGFRPDIAIGDGARIDGEGWSIDVLHTPGHFAGHLCFALGDALFSGDHVMGWASTVISPPDGDLGAYRESCARLLDRRARVCLPGHGAPVDAPGARLAWLMEHRREREAEILGALEDGPAAAPEIAARIYTETAPGVLPAAARSVLAHLIDLAERHMVAPQGRLGATTSFHRI